MNFDNEKRNCLAKLDKSKKGEIDKEILKLVELINSNSNYYTTSSCAGRIMLFKEGKNKKDSEWLFVSHQKVKLKDILPFLNVLPKENVWFRMEPPILHIACRNIEAAKKLIQAANNSGFRRTALIALDRLIVEIMIPEKMDAPLAEKGSLFVNKDYLKILIKKANHRLLKSRKRLKKFEKLISLIS